ncbi:MAG TPA: glycoside hydrolase family 15 protein [Bacteroidales bacterium]|nr:glycoside hydrolase family 15 protein [Bacteroidales bacterium]
MKKLNTNIKAEGIHRYDMGIVGNCSFLAYIDKDADVRWMCMPRFDSSFLFGSLLDRENGGEFSIKPTGGQYYTFQTYIKNTNILITEFITSDGKFRITDFAPRFYQYDRYYRPQMLVRKIELVDGNPFIKVKCEPVGEYGSFKPQIVAGSNHIRFLNFDTQVRLTTNIPLIYIVNNQSFMLNDTYYLVFTYGVPLEAPLEATAEDFLEKTRKYWVKWIKNTSIPNIFQDEIIRSALVLKLHQYEDTGGIIAAGTFGLPESPLAGRNWDYRYCWMRDSYYTLNAFNNLGHFDELERYFLYIQNIILSEKQKINPMYTIAGTKVPSEKILDLAGYLGNIPVRLGNDAVSQVQNDTYGQVLASLLPLYIDKRLNYLSYSKSREVIYWLLNKIEETMESPDAGIWEFRNRLQLNCYTYLFHWAGSKAAEKIASHFSDNDLKRKAEKLAITAAEKIELCYNSDLKAYMQAIGSSDYDAATLHLITMNYLNHSGDRAREHVEALSGHLMTEEGLLYRYIHDDDFGKPDTTFLVCAFWYVEALACTGKINEAFKSLENLLKYSNHLGLFSEDIGRDGSQWGNFPQTYSHVGLMNAIYRIAAKVDRPVFL